MYTASMHWHQNLTPLSLAPDDAPWGGTVAVQNKKKKLSRPEGAFWPMLDLSAQPDEEASRQGGRRGECAQMSPRLAHNRGVVVQCLA